MVSNPAKAPASATFVLMQEPPKTAAAMTFLLMHATPNRSMTRERSISLLPYTENWMPTMLS